MKKVKFISLVLLSILLFSTFSLFVWGEPDKFPTLDTDEAVLLYHNESDTLLYGKKVEELRSPGPVARLLAAYTAFLHYKNDLSKEIEVNRLVTGLATSTMNPNLKPKEHLSAYDLFCGFLIANSDDAIFALAFDLYEQDAASPGKLLAEMNETAENLGMTKSKFFSLTGVDSKDAKEKSVTTAKDTLLLVKKLREEPKFLEICEKTKHRVPKTDKSDERVLLTRNYLLSAARIPGYVYDPANGLAAFSHESFGHSLIATADFGGKSFTCILLSSKEQYRPFVDAKNLFEYADKNFAYKTVLSKTEILGEIKVILSKDFDYITVVPEKELSVFLPLSVDPKKDIQREIKLSFEELTAPVEEDLIAGSVLLTYKGKVIGEVDLVTSGSLSLSTGRYFLSLARNFFRSTAFLVICLILVLLFIVYILVNARVRYLRTHRPASLVFEEENFEENEEKEAVSPEIKGILNKRRKKKEEKEEKSKEKEPSQKGVPSVHSSPLKKTSSEKQRGNQEKESAKGKKEPKGEEPREQKEQFLPNEEHETLLDTMLPLKNQRDNEENADLDAVTQKMDEENTDLNPEKAGEKPIFENPYSDMEEEEKKTKSDGEYVPEGWGKS